MHQTGVTPKQFDRYRTTTKSNHALLVAENILVPQLTAVASNHVLVADIIYLWTLEDWFYIATVVGLFSRRVVGLAIDSHMRESLVYRTLWMALGWRQLTIPLLHHSDCDV